MKLATFLKVILLTVIVSVGSAQVSHAGIECQTDNEALRSMPLSEVTFTRKDGSTFEIETRTASTSQTRSAGFQYVCAETIAATPILFVFEQQVTPSFHMNNVVAGIDIAFIKPDSQIDSIQKMKPYVLILLDKPLYSANGPVIAAFETYPGFFDVNNIDLNAKVTWQLLNN